MEHANSFTSVDLVFYLFFIKSSVPYAVVRYSYSPCVQQRFIKTTNRWTANPISCPHHVTIIECLRNQIERLWRQWNPNFLIKRRLRHHNSCDTPHAAWAECNCQCQTKVKAFIIIAILSWCAFASKSDVNGDETCPQRVYINAKAKLLTFGGFP
jgi:hypothetical protein